MLCEESLNEQVSKQAIFYMFGSRRSLAYLKLKRPVKKDIASDIQVDDFLIKAGAPVSVQSVLERYERPMPDADEPLLKAPAPIALGPPPPGDMINDANLPPQVNVNRLAAAFAEDLAPLRERLARILEIEDPDLMRAKLAAFLKQLPQLLKDINADPESARVLEDQLQTGLLSGAQAGARDRKEGM